MQTSQQSLVSPTEDHIPLIFLCFLSALYLLWDMGCCASRRNGPGSASLLADHKQVRGNESNAEMLIAYYLRREEAHFAFEIPRCINYLTLQYYYENTNVVFDAFDDSNSRNVHISQNGKRVRISANTVFVFSDIGYSSGFHSWSVRLLHVHNCQALGIAQHKDATYRYGYNVFDSELNRQLGDRYIYAGDVDHGWRGSVEMRPYIMSARNHTLQYEKRLKLKDNQWRRGDVITVQIDFTADLWTILFLKNGERLREKMEVEKHTMYYPVFQAYSKGTFEIIED